MAYITLTNGAKQIFGFDSANASNLTISITPDDIKTTVQTLEAGLKVAQQMATAFGIDTSASSSTGSSSSSTASSGTTSGSTTSGSVSSGGTVTSGGSAG